MTDDSGEALCPEDRLAELLAAVAADRADADGLLDRLIDAYPGDPRLHFLQGSLRAAVQDYDGARAAMRHAVDLAPDFAVARFQLGFLLLTCGEAHAAQEAWGPLHGSVAGTYMGHFVDGLTHLIHDRFDQAITALEAGIAINEENPAMSADMRLIIDEAREKTRAAGTSGESLSAAHLLLQQAALKATRH